MQISKALRDDQKVSLFQIVIIAIIAFGILLRASKYVPAWSLRGDELTVALNLLTRSAIELVTQPLEGEQAAPFGFVLIIKTLITIFGHSEHVLRLTAFTAGCISLILMQILLTKLTRSYGNLVALAAFAFSNYLIYYSAELKPYSSDVLLCLILLLLFYRHLSRETTAKDFALLAVLGTLVLCLSYPAVFVIAAIGITLVLHYWQDKQKLPWTILAGIMWAITFLLLYFLLLRHQTQSSYLITYWDNLLSFMPMPPWRDIFWFPKALEGLFFVVAGLSPYLVLLIPIYVLGLWGLWSEKKWQWILVLILPITLNVVVSGFQKYPFHGRLILYLLPLVFLVLGKGIDFLIRLFRNRVLANVVFVALAVVLLRPAIPTANSYLSTHRYLQDDLKPVLAFVRDHKEDGDLVYMYHHIGQSYAYYAPAYHLDELPVIVGQNNSGNARGYREELSSLPRGQRIWFVFSFVHETRIRKGKKEDEREYILDYLMENGTLLDEFHATNNVSSAHLFILK